MRNLMRWNKKKVWTSLGNIFLHKSSFILFLRKSIEKYIYIIHQTQNTRNRKGKKFPSTNSKQARWWRSSWFQFTIWLPLKPPPYAKEEAILSKFKTSVLVVVFALQYIASTESVCKPSGTTVEPHQHQSNSSKWCHHSKIAGPLHFFHLYLFTIFVGAPQPSKTLAGKKNLKPPQNRGKPTQKTPLGTWAPRALKTCRKWTEAENPHPNAPNGTEAVSPPKKRVRNKQKLQVDSENPMDFQGFHKS